ncbi:hypothetical protein WA158_004429 [Blastocystis sp. Blastoise]
MSEKDIQRLPHNQQNRQVEESVSSSQMNESDASQMMARQNQYPGNPYSQIQVLMAPPLNPMFNQQMRNNYYPYGPVHFAPTQNIGVPGEPYLTSLSVPQMNSIQISRPDPNGISLSNDNTYHSLAVMPPPMNQDLLPMDESLNLPIMNNDQTRKRKRTVWNEPNQEIDKTPISYYPQENVDSIQSSILATSYLSQQQESKVLKLFETLDKDNYRLTDQFMQEAVSRMMSHDNRGNSYKMDPPSVSYIHQLLKHNIYLKSREPYIPDNSKKNIDNETYNRYFMSCVIAMPSNDETLLMNQRMLTEDIENQHLLDKDYEYKEKRKYTTNQLQWAVNATTKGLSTREAARQAHVPRSTLHDKIHTQRSTKPGKPTVLKNDEEAILATFVTLLDSQGIRIPREDVKKLVMGMLPGERGHPFKDDGPHRHWFRGFYKRNPQIMQFRSQSTPIPRTRLKQEQMDQFFEEVQRLRDENLVVIAAQRPQYARLDRTGFHFNIPTDPISINPISYSSLPTTTSTTLSSIPASIPYSSHSQQNTNYISQDNTLNTPNNLEKSSIETLHVSQQSTSLSLPGVLPSSLTTDPTDPNASTNNNNPNNNPTAPSSSSSPPTTTHPSLLTMSSIRSSSMRKKWSQETLFWAIDQITAGNIGIKEASERTNIPVATLRSNLKVQTVPGKRGPPTVLTEVEELALERFLIKLDDWGYKANRESLSKLVMDIVAQDGREHPFKNDGPHRHWFQGFYRRHSILDARRRASGTSLSRQDAPPELMKRFYDDLADVKQQYSTDDSNGSLKGKKSKLIANTPLDTVRNDLSDENRDDMGLGVISDLKSLGKKGGRPKLPLFSVQPCRQRFRTIEIMQYIRDFALQHDENVDDILWSLLIQRVKGSGYKEIGDMLQQLCKRWSDEIQICRIPISQAYEDVTNTTNTSNTLNTSNSLTNPSNSTLPPPPSPPSSSQNPLLEPSLLPHDLLVSSLTNPLSSNKPQDSLTNEDSDSPNDSNNSNNNSNTVSHHNITEDLQETLHPSLFDALNGTVNNSISNSLRNTMNNSLENSMTATLPPGLQNSMNNSITNSITNSMNNSMNNGMNNGMNNTMNSINNSISNAIQNTMNSSLNASIPTELSSSMNRDMNPSLSLPSVSLLNNTISGLGNSLNSSISNSMETNNDNNNNTNNNHSPNNSNNNNNHSNSNNNHSNSNNNHSPNDNNNSNSPNNSPNNNNNNNEDQTTRV